MLRSLAASPVAQSAGGRRDRALGVTVSQFTVGEYDIVVLSAKESNGLETWLNCNGLKIPQGAKRLLQSYIRQKMNFFVAKVNLTEFDKSGYERLRPITMAFESKKFMLPICLGMINSTSEQDLIVYILSPKGQAERTYYRTVNIPSEAEITLFVKYEFGDFYKSIFKKSYTQEDKKVAFLEYAWNMGSCDPCSAEPLNNEELRKAGVFWSDSPANSNVLLTRFHVRYTRDKFPEDLMFQETADNQFFQGRYVLRHSFKGEAKCNALRQYQRNLPRRFEQESQIAKLTGWNIQDIRKKNNVVSQPVPWWRNLWF